MTEVVLGKGRETEDIALSLATLPLFVFVFYEYFYVKHYVALSKYIND